MWSSSFMGTCWAFLWPIFVFFLFHGHKFALLVTVIRVFPLSRAQVRSSCDRHPCFSSFTGTSWLFLWPSFMFFLFHGHKFALLVTVIRVSSLSRAQVRSSCDRHPCFSSFTGTSWLFLWPSSVFFLFHGHKLALLVTVIHDSSFHGHMLALLGVLNS